MLKCISTTCTSKPQYNIALTFGTQSQFKKIPLKILNIICVSLISGRPHAADILGHEDKRTVLGF